MIKAIETRYKGYRFRSRLEARWAVFFDALNLKWEYEPEGFETSAGWYLPDFCVFTPQGAPTWYEIKPQGVHEDEKLNAFEAALNADLTEGQCSTARVSLLSGDPLTVFSNQEVTICPRCGFLAKPAYGFHFDRSNHPRLNLFEVMVGCWPCDLETPFGGDNEWEDGVLGIGVYSHKGWIVTCSKEAAFPWANQAAIKARSARFEHGEVPA